MPTFRVLPQSDLSEQHFEEWPVWSEHYDADEIEDIERWGLDREEVLRAFRDNERGNEHCVYTLLEANPFPPRMRIFIKASLEAANGQHLEGYVMNEDAFCLSVFSGGRTFFFSRHPVLEADNREAEQELLRSLGHTSTITIALFPMRYETRYLDTDGLLIAGSFEYGRRKV